MITNFLANSYLFFFVTLLVPSCLGRYSLVYHESLWDVLFSCCLHFKVHLLHIFRVCVEHVPNFLRFFLYVCQIIIFFLQSAPKTSSRCCRYFTFYSSKKSLIFHAVYLFNNIKYFRSLLQLYITVNFGKKRRKETIYLELMCDPT